MFRRALVAGELGFGVDDVRRELAGLDLACWCAPDEPCHADVLLTLANDEGAAGGRSPRSRPPGRSPQSGPHPADG